MNPDGAASAGGSFPEVTETASVAPIGRRIFRRDRPSIGVGISELRGPSLVPLLASAGIDYVLVDMEHTSLSFRDVAVFASAGRAVGLPVLVRPPAPSRSDIGRAMDLGADGLFVQRVGSGAEAAEAVRYMKYPPEGERGDKGSVYAARPDSRAVADGINLNTVLIVIVETVEGARNIDEICATPGVDAVSVGHADLSLALGVAGDLEAEPYRNAFERILESCRAHEMPFTIGTAGTAEAALEQVRLGSFSIFFDDELGIIERATTEYVRGVHSALASA